MAWLYLLLAVLTCAAVLGVPGVLVAACLRLRGLWLAAATPALGVSVIFATTYIAAASGLVWSIWPVLGTAGAAAIAILCLTRFVFFFRPSNRIPAPPAWITVTSASLAATLLGARILTVVVEPTYFAQEFDNVFHLNAVRHVLDVGVATPSEVALTTDTISVLGYPSAWHALTALVAQISGVAIPVASNAVLLTTACIVWPLSAFTLTRTLIGPRTSTAMAAGVLVAGLAAFPLLPIANYGGYPLVLAIALSPLALAMVVQIAGVTKVRLGFGAAALLLVGALPGLIGAHPSAVVWLLILSLPVLSVALIQHRRTFATPTRRLIAVLGIAVYVMAIVLVQSKTSLGARYLQTGTIWDALGEAITMSIGGQTIALVMATLAVIGGVAGARSRSAPWALATVLWITALTLYVIASAAPGLIRVIVVGPWYGSSIRLAAFAVVTAVPLAALGATVSWDALNHLATRRGVNKPRAMFGAAVFCLAGLVIGTQLFSLDEVTRDARTSFTPTDDHTAARLAVDDDGRAMFERVREIVPGRDVIANNPWDGSGFAYAITGREVLLAHQFSSITPEKRAILEGLSTADEASEACNAVRELDVRWVLRFEPPSSLGAGAEEFEGLVGLDRSPNVELAERIGTASLYRIVGCGIDRNRSG